MYLGIEGSTLLCLTDLLLHHLRLCLVWAMDGCKMAIGQDLMTRIDERSDKGYAHQVYVCQSIGATRMEESKVVTIQAHEA